MGDPCPAQERTAGAIGWVSALAVAAVTAWSAIAPVDPLTWWLEISWVLLGLPVAILVARTRGITTLLVVLLALHALLLAVGAHYTYERVPLGEWARHWTGIDRNNYDRLGHLMQGFTPAILARELLRRTSPLRPGGWLAVLCIALPVAFSACFEMIEWWAALALGEDAAAYLGSQGDLWDAQWDMCCALVGAAASVALLSGLHERQVNRLASAHAPRSR